MSCVLIIDGIILWKIFWRIQNWSRYLRIDLRNPNCISFTRIITEWGWIYKIIISIFNWIVGTNWIIISRLWIIDRILVNIVSRIDIKLNFINTFKYSWGHYRTCKSCVVKIRIIKLFWRLLWYLQRIKITFS